MNTLDEVEEFLAHKTIALAGMSRDPHAFSATVRRELVSRGYRVLPINPNAESVDGERCYANLRALPERVEALLLLTPPQATERVLHEAADAGIRHVWIQQGAESERALALCGELGLRAVSRNCILMFAEPVGSVHAFHRWFRRLFGRMPKER